VETAAGPALGATDTGAPAIAEIVRLRAVADALKRTASALTAPAVSAAGERAATLAAAVPCAIGQAASSVLPVARCPAIPQTLPPTLAGATPSAIPEATSCAIPETTRAALAGSAASAITGRTASCSLALISPVAGASALPRLPAAVAEPTLAELVGPASLDVLATLLSATPERLPRLRVGLRPLAEPLLGRSVAVLSAAAVLRVM
jgi:hypothetical protein